MKKFIFFSIAFLAAIVAFATGVVDLTHVATGLSFATMVPTTIDTARERVVYDRIQALLGQSFLVQPAFIRSEQVISNTKNSYQFETRSDLLSQQSRPLNKGVDNNDLFFAAAWGLFIDNRVTTSKSEVTLQTYPNSIAFAAATTGCSYNQLEIFYNSSIQFQVGSTVFYEAYDTQRFRKVPQTQQTAKTQGSTAAGNWSETDLGWALTDVAPYVVLSGSAQNKIILTIPSLPDTADMAVDTGTQATGENVLTLYFTGLTIKNGADNREIAAKLKGIGVNLS
jgi:hypothetical protein